MSNISRKSQQKVLEMFPICIYGGNVIVIPCGCGSSSDSGQAWHQSCRDVDDMEPGDIYFMLKNIDYSNNLIHNAVCWTETSQ